MHCAACFSSSSAACLHLVVPVCTTCPTSCGVVHLFAQHCLWVGSNLHSVRVHRQYFHAAFPDTLPHGVRFGSPPVQREHLRMLMKCTLSLYESVQEATSGTFWRHTPLAL